MEKLKLDRLIKDDEFRTELETDRLIANKLLKLIPHKYIKKFLREGYYEFPPLTREQIKKILIDNNLTSGDGVDELVNETYNLSSVSKLGFKKLTNNKGDILYQPYISEGEWD